MPIYEYVCLDCGLKFELMRSMRDADVPTACDQCQSSHTSRKLSLFNAQSGGRVLTGGGNGCASCSTNACSTCGSR